MSDYGTIDTNISRSVVARNEHFRHRSREKNLEDRLDFAKTQLRGKGNLSTVVTLKL